MEILPFLEVRLFAFVNMFVACTYYSHVSSCGNNELSVCCYFSKTLYWIDNGKR